MFELGGVTVTGGMVALALVLVAGAVWLTRRVPYVVVALVALIGAVHAVAYGTAYLDPARLASVRGTAFELARDGFLAAAGALDTAFAAIGWALSRGFDFLSTTTMPGATVSVLEFATFLLAVVVASAVVCGLLLWIVQWADGTPLGVWLAGLGVVFGMTGILWTWLPFGIAEATALHALSIIAAVLVGVIGGGYAITVVTADEPPTLGVRERVRAER
ncbi:hypothetical protein [Halalkalicoccus sp. NIPERK01]|uniref:hypothetical protein n=1 Tax=Halalkalicoccus sp. NIPERK01 TaxID=3053469 RepID=UPI00256F4021|nr:hypothetical protein [Halalkalicoccus sp. NIPERK01]MDL5362603.1 hypothetical protein [Halalkalicoccus sp. NIPERK01]